MPASRVSKSRLVRGEPGVTWLGLLGHRRGERARSEGRSHRDQCHTVRKLQGKVQRGSTPPAAGLTLDRPPLPASTRVP